MSILRTAIVGIAAVVCLIAGGCSAVSSKYPLSDEKTSKRDLDLLGTWKEKSDEESDEESDKAKEGFRIVEHPTSENALMVFSLPGKLDELPGLLLTTELDGTKYLSFGGRDPKSGETEFIICRYEMPDKDTVKLRELSTDAIRKAIMESRLSGIVTVVSEKKPEKSTMEQGETVQITAEPVELRAFLKANGDACFPKDQEPEVFVRVK